MYKSLFVCIALVVGSQGAFAQASTKHHTTHKITHHSTKAGHVDETVMKVQEALSKEGVSIKADGKMGQKTHVALKSFQKKNGLKVTGNVDAETLTKLGV